MDAGAAVVGVGSAASGVAVGAAVIVAPGGTVVVGTLSSDDSHAASVDAASKSTATRERLEITAAVPW
jgi:hypothetical protein